MNIKIEKSREICSCNSCNARNYESRIQVYNDATKKVDTIYKVQIGCMVNTLCLDCLAALIGKATVALASAE